MAYLNWEQRSINFKVCYTGAAGAGRTTNLAWLAENLSDQGIPLHRVDEISEALWMMSAPVAPHLPIEVSALGFRCWAVLYAAPVGSEPALSHALQFCDAVVFVVDSREERLRENLHAFRSLCWFVAGTGNDFDESPLVVQYNQRDALDAIAVAELRDALYCMTADAAGCWPSAPAALKARRFAEVEAVAIEGTGVTATLERAVARSLASPRVRGYLENVSG